MFFGYPDVCGGGGDNRGKKEEEGKKKGPIPWEIFSFSI